MHSYQGALSEDEFVLVTRLQRQLTPGVRPASEGLLAIGCGCLVMAAWVYWGGTRDLWQAAFWAVLGLPFVAIAAWLAWRWSPRRLWRSNLAIREPYSGCVTATALEARLLGVDARIPWPLLSARALGRAEVVLAGGSVFVPIVRSFFSTEQEWLAARSIIERSVPGHPSQLRIGPVAMGRTVLLWLVLLTVVFLAWHLARQPG